jgi:hypothetical protein
MDFTMVDGTRMTGKEKLITARDRAVTVTNKITVTGAADIGIVPMVRVSGSLLFWDCLSDTGLMN